MLTWPPGFLPRLRLPACAEADLNITNPLELIAAYNLESLTTAVGGLEIIRPDNERHK